MKKLLIACVLSLGAFTAFAQYNVTITLRPQYVCGQQVHVSGTISAQAPRTPAPVSYRWEFTPCNPDGSSEGDAVFSETYPGAPSGDFAVPGSENFSCNQNYRVELALMGNDNLIAGFATTVMYVAESAQSQGCISGGPTSISLPPGGSSSLGSTQILSLTPGNYVYTLSTTGNAGLVNNLVIAVNYISVSPNYVFQANSNTPFHVSIQLSPVAQLCTSEGITMKIYDMSSNLVCTYNINVDCKTASKQTLVDLSSGEYYKGDDNKLHRMYWTSNGWVYEAINPWGGWGSVEIDGWLTGEYTTDRVFFKGKDGKPYNIFLSNGVWYLGAISGLANVKSSLQMRSGELIYVGTDDLIHRLYWGGSSWIHQLITPLGGYNGVTALPFQLALPTGAGQNVFFSAADGTIMNLFPWGTNWLMLAVSTPTSCGGDMTFDDSQYRIYFKGSDGNMHNTSWASNTGWVYDAMSSTNGQIPASNNLCHVQGESRVFYKGNDNRVYQIWKQTNGQWRTDWVDNYGVYNGVAGDVVGKPNQVFFVSTSKQIGNYFYFGNPGWGSGILNGAPTNAVGCSSLYRLASQTVEENNVSNFNVFPNPNNGTFQIKIPESGDNIQGELYNMLGERVDAFTFSGDTYSYSPTQTFTPGIYLLRVNDGGKQYSQRIIVQ